MRYYVRCHTHIELAQRAASHALYDQPSLTSLQLVDALASVCIMSMRKRRLHVAIC